MNNKIRSELEKIEIPDELHTRATLGVKQAKAELVDEGVTLFQPLKNGQLKIRHFKLFLNNL
jgi:hypothetical protein